MRAPNASIAEIPNPTASALPVRLARVRRSVLRRKAAIVALQVLPVASALVAAAYRIAGGKVAWGCAVFLLAAWVVLTRRSLRMYDSTWLLRRLNATLPAFEDSIELALVDGPAAAAQASVPGGLQPLQRARIQRRLQEVLLPDLRAPYPRRGTAIAWACAVPLMLLAWIGPHWREQWRVNIATSSGGRPAAVPEGSLRIEPPAYTKLPSRLVASLDARAPAGSKIEFELRLGSAPAAAALQFQGGAKLELHRDGGDWRGARSFDESTLYRLQLDDAPPLAATAAAHATTTATSAGSNTSSASTSAASPAASTAAALHRIDVIPDHPPDILVHVPERSLNLLDAGQRSWDLEFEAADDYGLGPAELSIILAQGSGENIRSSEQTIQLDGTGDERHRRYRKTLDLAALGFGVGDDLIVRLSVSDNHPAPANRTQSASFILRWPAQGEAASAGMEGLVQKTMPAYFSSERQLIIDTEALIAARGSMDSSRFASRADDLGVQQKVLRLRYGQFLGEEFESNAERAPPGQEAVGHGHPALRDLPAEAPVTQGAPRFGDAGNIASEFGHVHDKPEAATLLDPETRRLLKLALDEMWQAELQLREASLDHALPYEHKALEYIKQVQQAERIYLARAGVQLPQVDTGRRLSGDRAGLSDRENALPAATPGDTPVGDAWRTLEMGGTPDWTALVQWTQRHRADLPDALALVSAADRAQRDPQCGSCRAEIERLLWPLLPEPPSALSPRLRPDAAGTAYVDALSAPPTADRP